MQFSNTFNQLMHQAVWSFSGKFINNANISLHITNKLYTGINEHNSVRVSDLIPHFLDAIMDHFFIEIIHNAALFLPADLICDILSCRTLRR